jgi:hypothetical protein
VSCRHRNASQIALSTNNSCARNARSFFREARLSVLLVRDDLCSVHVFLCVMHPLR